MGRLVNGERRIINPKPEYAGKLLIFCEGYTEYNYLNYFKEYLENNLRAPYSDIILEPINAKGNAMKVYKFAEEFLKSDEDRRKYRFYEKHLVFDCDAPDNIQEVIKLMKESTNEYILDLSNLLFETWLVMHYQNLKPDDACGKRDIIKYIRDYLGVSKYNSTVKASPGTIGKILGNAGNQRIRHAIENGKNLEKYWDSKGYNAELNIKSMNPYVKIYVLIERLLDEIIYLCK